MNYPTPSYQLRKRIRYCTFKRDHGLDRPLDNNEYKSVNNWVIAVVEPPVRRESNESISSEETSIEITVPEFEVYEHSEHSRLKDPLPDDMFIQLHRKYELREKRIKKRDQEVLLHQILVRMPLEKEKQIQKEISANLVERSSRRLQK